MELKARLAQVLEPQTITKKDGNTMTKRGIVVETDGQYRKLVAFTIINQNIQIPNIGTEVLVKYDLSSREYNGRWYTEATAWSVISGHATQPQQAQPANNPYSVVEGKGTPLDDDPNGESLPF